MSRGVPKKVQMSLEKALDSALSAVEMYNKPAVKFKSGGYIVLMCIAWTSLFHAIFIRKNIKPIYKEKDRNRYKKVDGELQYWELKTCVSKYFGTETNNPIRKNLEFFIPLRNKLEHKFMPELDPNIFAECQSLLMNFDKIVEKEFGSKYCLRESLSFALQLFPSSRTLAMAVKGSPEHRKIADWIASYRSSISTEILNSGDYSFKAFLIQVANHNSKEALPIQFYAYDKLSDEEKRNVNRIAALVKEKVVLQNVTNADLLNPSQVVELVQKALGNPKKQVGKKVVDKFNADTHTRCWKKYGIRPKKGDANPEKTNGKYCIYDSRNENYGYTKDWVDFLVEKMKDDNEYNSLYKK